MSILATPSESDATGLVAELYQEDVAAQGYVASHTAVMALNPEAVRAWEGLIRTIALPLGKRRYELVTLAAARGLRSRHCLLAHGARTLALIDEPELVRIARDYRDADLSEAEVAMMAFAERVSQDAYAMTDDDSRRLREHGFECPRDVSVVGFDDIWVAATYWPPLTTIRQPRQDLGRVATATLLDQLEGRKPASEGVRITLPSELIVRGSTAAPRMRSRAVGLLRRMKVEGP